MAIKHMRCLHLIQYHWLACKRKKRMCRSATKAYPHRKNFKGCAALFEIGDRQTDIEDVGNVGGACTFIIYRCVAWKTLDA